MVEYNIIKYCRACRHRFVVGRGESGKNYCDKCQRLHKNLNSGYVHK